jgi:hypothetical protein
MEARLGAGDGRRNRLEHDRPGHAEEPDRSQKDGERASIRLIVENARKLVKPVA